MSAPPETGAEGITLDELQLAARNHGLPLEALRYDVTPVGLHYLLVHYDIPPVDPTEWRLAVAGRVERPLTLALDELQRYEPVEVVATMECAGNGRARLSPRPISQPWLLEAVGNARWRGVPVRRVLEEAGVLADAVEVLFTGLDRGLEKGVAQSYERSLPLETVLVDDVLLAYEMNGAPLLPQHGFPLRLVVPGWYGMTNVKWLASIEVRSEPFEGYQHTAAYRIRADEDDDGTPVTRMQPRALMVPPGIPDFHTRVRTVPVGVCMLEGRAWSGWGAVAGVEVSVDGGETWAEVELAPPAGEWAWRRWTYEWQADEPGPRVLCCRARDAAGNVQPEEAAWNVGGYSNNSVQRVQVIVEEPGYDPGAPE
ncbi:MAG TPA: sulfite oxidase [Gaiellaceae bacterium]|nr:sulfite oxidase [Gaiellaceae bacterium]